MNGKNGGSIGFGWRRWSLCWIWHREEPPDIAFTGNAIGRSKTKPKKKKIFVEITLTERHAVCVLRSCVFAICRAQIECSRWHWIDAVEVSELECVYMHDVYGVLGLDAVQYFFPVSFHYFYEISYIFVTQELKSFFFCGAGNTFSQRDTILSHFTFS